MRRRFGYSLAAALIATALGTACTVPGAITTRLASTKASAAPVCAGEDVGVGAQAVRICRDPQYGVPSVYASQMPGVWFGTGWAQAEDRLVQLDLVRRNARGTLSQLFGTFDPSTIEQDQETLTLFYTDAELQAQFDSLPQWIQNAVTNFVDGLNAYVDFAYVVACIDCAARPVPILRRRVVAGRRRLQAAAVHGARRRRERQLPRARVRGRRR